MVTVWLGLRLQTRRPYFVVPRTFGPRSESRDLHSATGKLILPLTRSGLPYMLTGIY